MKKTWWVRGTTILSTSLCAASGSAQIWTKTGAPEMSWASLACSADGRRLIASPWNSPDVFVSTNSGSTWTEHSVSIYNISCPGVASSADGTTMAAVDARAIYLSTDLGSTWTTSTTLLQDGWCIACSADGRTMLAGDSGPMHGAGQLHLSTNSGATWNVPAGTYGYWRAVASSASGSIFVAGEDNNVDGRGLLYSTNSGDTWVLVGFSLWTSTACSADGTKMFACDYRGISRSSDNGSEWTLATMGPVQAIACSADGTRLIATGGGRVFTSTDCGANWVTNDVLKTNWNPVACSADGSRMYAAVNGGGIYTSQTTPAPVLNISRSGNSVLLSWVIPSTQFALQESADLTAWSGVSVSPVINYTNLHHEVSLLAPLEPKFYRLATP